MTTAVSYAYSLTDRLFDPLTLIQNDNGTSENKFTEDTLTKEVYVALSILLGCCLMGTGHLIYFIATKITENMDFTTTKTANIVLSYLSDPLSAVGLKTVDETTRYLKNVLGRSLKFESKNLESFKDGTKRVLVLETYSRVDLLVPKISNCLKEKDLEEETIIILVLPSDQIIKEQDVIDLLKIALGDDTVCPSLIILHRDPTGFYNDYNKKKIEYLHDCLH
ncbi:MAG: hypothetical protein H0T62_02715 [Parachlamydiaceae bacterium]|nr:hypothetical protein [Parachlamydiaceae bacterium]